MTNSKRMQVRLPKEVESELREIAQIAGLSVESVIKLALAIEVRRWRRMMDEAKS